jgi:hypothetical protein
LAGKASQGACGKHYDEKAIHVHIHNVLLLMALLFT